MAYRNTNVRGAQVTPAQEARLFELMRAAFAQYEHDIRSPSGATQAEAELRAVERRFWVMIWEGVALDVALAESERQWRAYAAKNNAAVDAAPRVKHGPYAGASARHWRWVSPDAWTSKLPYLTTMTRTILATAS